MAATVIYPSSGGASVDVATTTSVGTVKPDGTTITIDSDGTIHGVERTQIATTGSAGTVKPDGTTITIDSDGTIHGAEATPLATTDAPGKVMPDGDSITVDADGRIASNLSAELPLGIRGSGRGRSLWLNVPSAADQMASNSWAMSRLARALSAEHMGQGIRYTEDGLFEVVEATSDAVGVVMPDGETTFVNDGVMSARSYEGAIASLVRRVTALEAELGVGMTYEDGTLYVGSTLEDGTLVTGRTYDDGTLS